MNSSRRAIVLVLDGLGIGALPDASDYGDEGTDTLGHICDAVERFSLPNLAAMGLGNLGRFSKIPTNPMPSACHGRMAQASAGKDTTMGHWELMGRITRVPFPTYPNGFPPEIIRTFEAAIGTGTLGNVPASGTEIIQRLGEDHLRTAFPIVYTSADSVFQIAAHEQVISVEDLYAICRKAREILVPPHGVSRVIARPFTGKPRRFTRTDRRHDFSVPPAGPTLLNGLKEQGFEVVGIGKIEDIFAGSGLTNSLPTRNNKEGIERTLQAMDQVASGLILANFVDFDMLFGHRNDAKGYAEALTAFDLRVPELLRALRPEDLLVITADHGCDPTTPGTDHTREYVPLLVYGRMARPGILVGTRSSMADLGKTLQEFLGAQVSLDGTSFWTRIASGSP